MVDDDLSLGSLVARWVELEGFEPLLADSGEACLAQLTRSLPSALVLDLNMPGIGGMEVLERVRKSHPRLPVIVLTADRDVATVVEAMRHGAFDFLAKPIERTKFVTTLGNAVERYRMAVRLRQLEREVEGRGQGDIIGQSPAMKRLFRQLGRLAGSDVTVLIQGESGTGKELIARSIHRESERRDGPFVALNCAAIPDSLQESELFGHEKGAFTGAEKRRLGRFEEADGGTLFLDEVAELSLSLQAKLLRALQERTFRRVGGSTDVVSDFRLVAATHRDLRGQVEADAFREDLYFRIAVFELAVPPLREREGDLPLLVERLLAKIAPQRSLSCSPDTLALLAEQPWPGNVRELENALHHATVVCEDDLITPSDLPTRLDRPAAVSRPEPTAPAESIHEGLSLEEIERRAIQASLGANEGNLSEVCRQLGIGRTTLYRKLKKYGLR
ncbi:MAG: sigma-54 dependent transcriptional regulator [Acidobacteriota bacterium]